MHIYRLVMDIFYCQKDMAEKIPFSGKSDLRKLHSSQLQKQFLETVLSVLVS